VFRGNGVHRCASNIIVDASEWLGAGGQGQPPLRFPPVVYAECRPIREGVDESRGATRRLTYTGDLDEIETIITDEVLKREVVQGEAADEERDRVKKAAGRSLRKRSSRKKKPPQAEAPTPGEGE
jgi:hypothetical protein